MVSGILVPMIRICCIAIWAVYDNKSPSADLAILANWNCRFLRNSQKIRWITHPKSSQHTVTTLRLAIPRRSEIETERSFDTPGGKTHNPPVSLYCHPHDVQSIFLLYRYLYFHHRIIFHIYNVPILYPYIFLDAWLGTAQQGGFLGVQHGEPLRLRPGCHIQCDVGRLRIPFGADGTQVNWEIFHF